jgi:di/tricarboxylate transporter
MHVLSLTGLVAALSAFMNNVGALTLVMPIALKTALQNNRSPSMVLMPLAFGSILGGLMTMIGTPANIIVASYREQMPDIGEPFGMFSFSPVGAAITLVGVAFVSLVGWRLMPRREGPSARERLFKIEEYMTEVRITNASTVVGLSLRDLETLAEGEVSVAGLIRGEVRRLVPSKLEHLRVGDVVILQVDPSQLGPLISETKMELVGEKKLDADALKSDEVSLIEAVVTPGSPLEGRTPYVLHEKTQGGVNLLAVARQNEPIHERLEEVRFRVGDVLLLQGDTETLPDAVTAVGCLPLAERGLESSRPNRVALAVGVFAVALALTAMGVASAPVAFVGAAAAMVLLNLVNLREVYESIDWPVIVLLAAMIPVGEALQSTNGTGLIAHAVLAMNEFMPAWGILVMILAVTMVLTSVINNAATAVVMAPIAASVATQLAANPDAFLMAVAIGASSAFLTPIGHQSNTLVLGPGGYKFSDYWPMGLPLQILIIVVAVPLLLVIWPL